VVKGYRADTYSQVETLVYAAFTERTTPCSAQTLRRRSKSPSWRLVDRIARDEVRHEQFFANLVAHCLEYTRDETIAAIAARAADLEVVGATSTTISTRCRTSPTPAFSARTAAPGDLGRHRRMGVADEPNSSDSLSARTPDTRHARRACTAPERHESSVDLDGSDTLCCQGGTSLATTEGPARPGAAAPPSARVGPRGQSSSAANSTQPDDEATSVMGG